MNLFVISDVHGCYYTWRALLQHWQPAQEELIQLGDLIDRGAFSPATVASAISLQQHHPTSTHFLKGNHEAGLWRHCGPDGPYPAWLSWGGQSTVNQYRPRPDLLRAHAAWLHKRPLFWENQYVFASHAGIANTLAPLDESNPNGILWRRGPLRNIGKLQLVGHTPTPDGKTSFDAHANALYLDTGAYQGRGLTGVRLTPEGNVLEVITVPTDPADIL